MSFDRIAPFYRAIELITAGGRLQRCRLEFLTQISFPSRILIAGEGHGPFLPECSNRFPDARITVIDSSARMLGIARAAAPSGPIDFIHADLLTWTPPPATFDLIVTHFFLDCFPPGELDQAVKTLASAATPDAKWLIADFSLAPAGAARIRSRAILALLYGFFRIVAGLKARQLTSPDSALENAGFRKTLHRSYEWHLLKSECWQRTRPCGHPDAGL